MTDEAKYGLYKFVPIKVDTPVVKRGTPYVELQKFAA